jgi:hypothetical protein
LVASVLALPLCGCATYDTVTDTLDPTEWFGGDFFGLGAKKKMPGERKAVFPEGVPGVAKGVPPDLIKGNQAAAEAEQQAAIIPPEDGKAKPKAKPKPKPKAETAAVQRAPTAVTVRRAPEAQPNPPPQQQQGGAQQWPEPPAARSAQPAAGSGGGGVQWPDPPQMR